MTKHKNPAAVALGKLGGKASGALKTSAQMSAIASLPRKPGAPRCACGEMTLKRANARGHKC
jgi:hypothetical protein